MVYRRTAQSGRALSQAILNDADQKFLLAVADKLFRGRILEEKAFAVILLQGMTSKFGDAEFKPSRLGSRASAPGPITMRWPYLIGPMIAEDTNALASSSPGRKSKNRWLRRAAAVSLIRAIREQKCRREVVQISNLLLNDKDDMVQKDSAGFYARPPSTTTMQTLPYLMKIRERAQASLSGRPAKRCRQATRSVC